MEKIGARSDALDLTRAVALVTGSTGLLGAHLLPRLIGSGTTVYTATPRPLPVIGPVRTLALDPADPAALHTAVESLRPDLVIHLDERLGGEAGIPPDPAGLRAWLADGVSLLWAAQSGSVGRLVLVSGDPRTGGGAIPPGWAGGSPSTVLADYAALYTGSPDTPVIQLRPTQIYGPGQRPTELLPRVGNAVLRGTAPTLRDGSRRRDWVYVTDVVEGVLAAARSGAAGTDLELGSGGLHSTREVVELLLRALGVSVEPIWDDSERPEGPDRVRAADLAATVAALGWQPRITLPDGIRRTAQAIRRQSGRTRFPEHPEPRPEDVG